MRNISRAFPVCLALLATSGLTCRDVQAAEPASRIYIEDQVVDLGTRGFSVPVRADADKELHGFSIAIKYDPTMLRLVTFDAGNPSRPLVDLAGTASEGAEWSNGGSLSEEGKLHFSLVMDLSHPIERAIPSGKGQVLMNLFFDSIAAAPATTIVAPQAGLGGAPGGWTNLLARRGDPPTYPVLLGGRITLRDSGQTLHRFLLGDANGDHDINLVDVVALLGFMFLDSTPLPCMEACNANSDAGVDLSDPIFLLFFLYIAGTPPRLPFPACEQALPADCAEETCAGL